MAERNNRPRVFQSGTVVGTGAAQNTPHGLGVVPRTVLAVIIQGDNGAGAAGIQQPAVTTGVHDATNAIFSLPLGSSYQVAAIV